MQKRTLLILFLLAIVAFAEAAPAMRYRASALGGMYLAGGQVDTWKYKDMPIITGAELAVELSPNWQYLHDWNNASIGVAVDYLNLTNNDKLGHAIGTYAYLNIPLVRLKHWELGLRPGVGLAFCTKTYYNTIASDDIYKIGMSAYPANYAIGSVTNAYFAEALYMDFPIKNGWAITTSFAWHHLSNGSIRQPNSGYNMMLGQIGVTKNLPPTPSQGGGGQYSTSNKLTNQTAPLLGRGRGRFDIELSFAGGARQAYYGDKGQTFYAGSVNLSTHWIAHPIFKLGGGFDLFYDAYYQSVTVGDGRTSKFSKTYLTEPQLQNCFRLGVSLQPEFIIGKFTAGFHFGVYLYDPIKNLEPYSTAQGETLKKGIFYKYDILNAGVHEDGWLYTRIVLKYRITKHLFIQGGLKAHLTKAEFIDLGIGVSL